MGARGGHHLDGPRAPRRGRGRGRRAPVPAQPAARARLRVRAGLLPLPSPPAPSASRRCWMHPARRRRACGPRGRGSGSRRPRTTTARSPRSSQCSAPLAPLAPVVPGPMGPSAHRPPTRVLLPLSRSRRAANSRATRLRHKANPSKGGDAKPGIFGERHLPQTARPPDSLEAHDRWLHWRTSRRGGSPSRSAGASTSPGSCGRAPLVPSSSRSAWPSSRPSGASAANPYDPSSDPHSLRNVADALGADDVVGCRLHGRRRGRRHHRHGRVAGALPERCRARSSTARTSRSSPRRRTSSTSTPTAMARRWPA